MEARERKRKEGKQKKPMNDSRVLEEKGLIQMAGERGGGKVSYVVNNLVLALPSPSIPTNNIIRPCSHKTVVVSPYFTKNHDKINAHNTTIVVNHKKRNRRRKRGTENVSDFGDRIDEVNSSREVGFPDSVTIVSDNSLLKCKQESGSVTCNDGTGVVSPYFIKKDDGDGGKDNEGEGVKKKKRKKTVGNDFVTHGANDHVELVTERMDEVVEPRKNKEKKRKKGKTFLDDQELHPKKKSDKKVKKGKVHNECCVEDGKEKHQNSGVESEDPFLSDCRTEVKNEAVAEVIRSSYVTSNDGSRVVSPYFMMGEGNVTKDDEDKGVKKQKRTKTVGIDSVAYGANGHVESISERVVNVAESRKNKEKKRKKGRYILDDQEVHTEKKSDKRKIKERRALSECLEDGNQNRSTGVECQDPFLSDFLTQVKNEAIGELCRRERTASNMEHNCRSLAEPREATSHCSKNARRKRVKGGKPDKTIDGPRLQVDVKEEDEGDEPSRSTFCTVEHALISFDQMLSKYTYKGATVNSVRDNADGDGVHDEVSGKKMKQRRGILKTYLTRQEKFLEAYRKKDPNCTWKPPSSPYNLLQEEHAHDPWRVLIICMLLNITTGPQVRKVLSLFFQLCPNAEAALNTNEIEIARVIQSLGLHWKRATMIRRFSREYLSDDWTHVTQLHGIGKYAADAHAIFCTGMWNQITPNDHMLNHYWKFLRNRSLRTREFEKFL